MTHHGIPWPRKLSVFRMGIPPSMGEWVSKKRARLLEEFLTLALGQTAEVEVAVSYETLAKDLLSGRVDAAWAPPFVCAKVEAMGLRVLLRSLRYGHASYRAALVTRRGYPLQWNDLWQTRAVWSDQDSVGGYLLPSSYLRSLKVDVETAFASQHFVGSYREAVQEVLDGFADLTSVFAPAEASAAPHSTGLEEIWPGSSAQLNVVALTEAAPNDGVAVSLSVLPHLSQALERTFLHMTESPTGQQVLREVFAADGFELAPRMSYRALYRVSMPQL